MNHSHTHSQVISLDVNKTALMFSPGKWYQLV
jgi:hypothetical protein